MRRRALLAALACAIGYSVAAPKLWAQVAPSSAEVAAYSGLHRAAAAGDMALLKQAISSGADVNARDAFARTPLHVAAHFGQRDAMRALATAGADANALEQQAYDIVTIAAVADDIETLKTALAIGGRADNITSPYHGTALIAAAHLGHDEAVRLLIAAGAPLDHVNNLGWTALIEAVILGDGGPRHQKTVAYLLAAGADRSIADRGGKTPLMHASARGYSEMVALLAK